MIDFSYRITCVISVPDQELLSHAFHFESSDAINETRDSPSTGKLLAGGMDMEMLFAESITEYATTYGLRMDQIKVVKYILSVGADHIVGLFSSGINEQFETQNGKAKVLVYYKEMLQNNHGLALYEYISKLPNNTYAVRLGEQVPTGDVNLAYIHTPRLSVEENVAMIDTSFSNENIIPDEQLQSIVVPDENGVLSYADIVSDYDPIVMRPPYQRFPSKDVNITRRFAGSEQSTSNALYYKFELKYHYDSQSGEVGEVKRYKGSQIKVTDENGNDVPEGIKHLIYVQATPENPKTYWVRIYIQQNTDEEQTFKVQYNHVEKPAPDSDLHSVNKTVELYANQDNAGMIEGGKLRVINGVSAYELKTLSQLGAESELSEAYAIEEYADRDGYKITVPQKSMRDPRAKNPFSFKLTASFPDDKGSTRKITCGYMTDWVISPDALLAHEKLEYSEDQKMVGIRSGNGFMSARSLIEMMLPLDMPSLPLDASFQIEDAAGNLLYTVSSSADNSQVITEVATTGDQPGMAKAVSATTPWTGASANNVRIKNNPIAHQVTVFPERQKSELNFEWEASGAGEVTSNLSYKGRWKVCQQLTIEQKFSAKTFDIFNSWRFIGTDVTRGKWEYSKARDVLLLTANAVEVSGYYNGDHMNKENYIFSACVQVNDANDDDVIGIMFRVNSDQEYYTFLWEKDQLMQSPGANGNGVGRILVGERGVSAVLYYRNPDPTKFNSAYEHETDMTKYMNNYGFKSRKKGIFKAKRSTLPAYSDALHPNCKYKSDVTGSSFEEITKSTNYNAKGWVAGETYKIRVVVAGNKFRVYIGNDTSDDALGTLVCEAEDSSFTKGSYGICNISQENAYWSRLKITELDVTEVCTDWEDVTLTSNDWVKVSNMKPAEILKPQIDKYMEDNYGADMPYTEMPMQVVGDPVDLRAEVRNDGYIWAVTSSYEAGGAVSTPWSTEDNRQNITGKGKAVMRADGSMLVTLEPAKLSRDGIPDDVENFSWNRIWTTGGDPATVYIGADDSVTANVDVPPITPIGVPMTYPKTDTAEIYKQDGIKSLGLLLGSGNIYEDLSIPADIPKKEILLRIERGDSSGNNKEHRVNYRWRYRLDGRQYFEVDQMNGGVNRMRMRNIMSESSDAVIPGLAADLCCWTTFEELESVPVLAIKIDESKKIEAEKPRIEQVKTENENWYVRIKNGRVKKRINLPFYEPAEKIPQIYTAYPELAVYAPSSEDVVREVILDYTIPEYNNQEFYNRPVMLIERESPEIINEKMIQLSQKPVALKSAGGVSYLEVQAIRGNNARKMKISDIDAAKGVVYLHDKIREQDEVIVRYAYVEEWYTYRGFSREGSFFHMDFNPSPGHKFTVAKDGLHEWIPGDVNLRESYTVQQNQGNQLLVKQIHLYLRPTSIWLQEESGARMIDGTTRSQAAYHTDEGYWFDPEDYSYDPTMLRLAKFNVQANSNLQRDTIIMDTRTRGGGLDEALTQEIIKQVNAESMHHWDIGYFDGAAYQENGVMIIRLPRSILKTEKNPGGFTAAEVQAAVQKHKVYGTLPIIEYYDPEEVMDGVITNPEFLNNQFTGDHNKSLSSGVYYISEEDQGTGDNSILVIKDGGIYTIQLPAARFNQKKYTIEIKARKASLADNRLSGKVAVTYPGISTVAEVMPLVNSEEWRIYKYELTLADGFQYVIVEINSSDGSPQGDLLVDYVKMEPIFEVVNGVEIVEL